MMSVIKIRNFSLTFSLICFMVSSMALPSFSIPKDDIVGLWLFDEGKGEELKDTSGNNNHGKLVNGPKWADSKFGKALDFDASKQQRVEIPDSASLNLTEQITISAWGYLADVGGNRRFLQKSTPGSDNQYRLLLEWGAFKFDAGPGVTPKEITTPIFSVKEWHHVAGVYNGKEIALYIDGKKVASQAATGKMVPAAGGVTFIGTKWAGAPAGDYWNGMIDEVAIFKRGLTENEVNEVMKSFAKAFPVEAKGKLPVFWGNIKIANSR